MRSDGERREIAGIEVVDLGRRRAPRAAREPARLLRALVEAMLPEEAAADAPRVDRVTRFVDAQVAALSPAFRVLVQIGLLGFRSLVALRHARGFCSLDPATRRRVVHGWSFGPLPPARQLFRMLRGPALLAWYDLPAQAPGGAA